MSPTIYTASNYKVGVTFCSPSGKLLRFANRQSGQSYPFAYEMLLVGRGAFGSTTLLLCAHILLLKCFTDQSSSVGHVMSESPMQQLCDGQSTTRYTRRLMTSLVCWLVGSIVWRLVSQFRVRIEINDSEVNTLLLLGNESWPLLSHWND